MRPGIYTGNESCESKLMIESLEPIITPSSTVSSITVTAEGYPASSGLELRPGATSAWSSESGTVNLTVTGYQPLPAAERQWKCQVKHLYATKLVTAAPGMESAKRMARAATRTSVIKMTNWCLQVVIRARIALIAKDFWCQ